MLQQGRQKSSSLNQMHSLSILCRNFEGEIAFSSLLEGEGSQVKLKAQQRRRKWGNAEPIKREQKDIEPVREKHFRFSATLFSVLTLLLLSSSESAWTEGTGWRATWWHFRTIARQALFTKEHNGTTPTYSSHRQLEHRLHNSDTSISRSR